MDALLILGGLLLMVAGYIWVIVLAFGTGLLWGYGSLFPPVALAYIGVHWRTARKGVGLAALGCIPLVVGLALLASHDAARLEAILSLRWLKPEARPPAELAIALSGEFNGKPFAPQSGELIGGVLSLRQGHDFYAQRELQIRLPAQPLGALRLDVLPEDGGALPEVELSWLQPDQDLPEARRLLRGYTLHLDLRPKAPNRLEGEFHLSTAKRLPDHPQRPRRAVYRPAALSARQGRPGLRLRRYPSPGLARLSAATFRQPRRQPRAGAVLARGQPCAAAAYRGPGGRPGSGAGADAGEERPAGVDGARRRVPRLAGGACDRGRGGGAARAAGAAGAG
ncbi:major facilitator superfamily permease [Pseudomonas aeruginosa PA38182]|nr:major facilitator superfamily permease [Pseudomonas aeruginosa PA38182]